MSMKRQRRRLALLAAALLAAFSLGGCGEKGAPEAVTAEHLLADVRKNLAGASSLEGAWSVQAQVHMPAAGTEGAPEANSQEGTLCLSGDMQVTDRGWTHLTADLEMASAGQMQQGSVELYLKEETDRRKCYLALDGSWEYQELPAAEEPAFQVWDRLLGQEAEWTLTESALEDGREVYVLTASASLDTWGAALVGDTDSWSQVRDLLTGTGLDPAGISVELSCQISREELFPLKLEAKMERPFSVTQEDSPLSGKEVEGSLTWSGISRDTVEALAIPEEAQAAETAPAGQEPGVSTEGEMEPDTGLEGEIQLEEEFLPEETAPEPSF